MNGPHRMSVWAAGLAVAVLAAWAPASLAQPPRGGDRNMEPAWTLQAQAVADELKLGAEQKQKLVDAYVASRKSYVAAAEQISGEGRDRFEAMMKVADAERAKLKESLGGTLSAEQVDTAMSCLGSYNRQADRMVGTIAELKLEPEAQQKALALINAYAAEMDAMRAKASSREDWQGMRTAMQDAKTKLDKAMGEVLSETQLATWNEATAWRGRGGSGGRGSREGGQGGGGGDAAPSGSGSK